LLTSSRLPGTNLHPVAKLLQHLRMPREGSVEFRRARHFMADAILSAFYV
jgi:hypothetical protein